MWVFNVGLKPWIEAVIIIIIIIVVVIVIAIIIIIIIIKGPDLTSYFTVFSFFNLTR